MTPIQFLLEHREDVLLAYDGSPLEAWQKLVDRIHVDKAMTENTFRTMLKPFAETCRYFDGRLNEMTELNEKLNSRIQELSDRLNVELNKELAKYRLNVSDSELNVPDNKTPNRLNIAGWTVAKSGQYYRAFRKIKGRVYGVHLGKDLTDAETKISRKERQIKVAPLTSP